MKRKPNVPMCARSLDPYVSKADLWEVAWALASLANDAGSCDDERSTLKRLILEIDVHRSRRDARVLTETDIGHAHGMVGQP